MSESARVPPARRTYTRRAIAAGIALTFVSIIGGLNFGPVLSGEPAVVFKDVSGQAQTPLSQANKKATVLFFLLPDCPISNSYAPEIKRICGDFEPKKIAAFVVHADPDVTAEQARKHAKEYGLPCPVLLDPAHVLVKKTGVTKAPEVAVLGSDEKLLYRGRIDDWYPTLGKRRGEPTQRDLRNALDAIVQGKAVMTPTTQAVGCYLPAAKEESPQKSEQKTEPRER